MTDVRCQRLERYETWAAECETLARLSTDDPVKQAQYERLAAHYSYLASSFRKAITVHSVALSRLTLH